MHLRNLILITCVGASSVCLEINAPAATCFASPHAGFDTYFMWESAFGNGGPVGPNGEIFEGDGGLVGPNGEQPTTGSPSSPVPSGGGSNGGPILSPNDETPSGGIGNPSSGPLFGPGGEILGPDGQVLGGGAPDPIGPGPIGPGPIGPGPIGPDPIGPGPAPSGPITSGYAILRPLNDVTINLSDENFNRSFSVPGFQKRASVATPGPARPTPPGQQTAFHQDFSNITSGENQVVTTNGGEAVQAETIANGEGTVSGLRIRTSAGGSSLPSQTSIRPQQTFATPTGLQKYGVQWTVGDIRGQEAPTAGPDTFSTQIRLGISSTKTGRFTPEHLCASEEAVVSLDLTYDGSSIGLLTLSAKASGQTELVVPFASYIELEITGSDDFGLGFSSHGIDVLLSGEPILSHTLLFSELGMSGIEEFGEHFDVFALSSNLGQNTGSFLLDDLLVYQNFPVSVPEPNTILLILLGSLLISTRRR